MGRHFLIDSTNQMRSIQQFTKNTTFQIVYNNLTGPEWKHPTGKYNGGHITQDGHVELVKNRIHSGDNVNTSEKGTAALKR
jgi:hypothetical protein